MSAVLPEILERKWGRIINLSTITALEPLEDFSLSNATRLACLGYFRTLALETAKNGVIVNSILVGHTDTTALKKYLDQIAVRKKITVAAVERGIIAQTPIRRHLLPEETAALVTFLCSELASGMIGQTLRLDGGFSRTL